MEEEKKVKSRRIHTVFDTAVIGLVVAFVIIVAAVIVYTSTHPDEAEVIWVVGGSAIAAFVLIGLALIPVGLAVPRYYEDYLVWNGKKFYYSDFDQLYEERTGRPDMGEVSVRAHYFVGYLNGRTVHIPIAVGRKNLDRLKGLDEKIKHELMTR